MPYKLAASLQAHTADVRAVLAPSSLRVFSASRDSSAIVWSRANDTSPFTATTVYKPSSGYVGSLAFIPPTGEAPEGYLVVGSQDSIIYVYALGNGSEDPKYMLIGHQHNVCTLDATAEGTIVSGSWDKSARVWKNWDLAYELQGHTQSVLAVIAIPPNVPSFSSYGASDQYLTASADKSIRLWVKHKAVRTYHGHSDVVRALVLIPDIGFASSSNDTEIRVWTAEGDTVHILSGHTSFVYSLSLLDDGDIVSGGEDRTLRVWKDGECTQSIVHPAISVWSVAAVAGSGDVVSGCSDGIVRVFSLAETRWLGEADLKAYEEQLAASAIPAQTAAVDKSNLPGLEALNVPGKKEGQVIMVSTPSGGVEAHQWTEGSWQKVGDVVEPPGGATGGKQMYKGKEYDHVFEVDIAEGQPKVKLPYNESEDAYVAAQRFLNENNLPMTYLDEVVNYIDKMAGSNRQAPVSNQFVDPFTGAGRYVPGGTQSSSNTSTFVDPFTGASRYQAPSAPVVSAAPSSQFMDPFTGASRYSGAPQPSPQPAAPPPAQTKILPVRQTLPFKTANLPAMRSKLLQLNEILNSDVSTSTLVLSASDLQALERIFDFLNKVTPAGNSSLNLAWGDIELILQVLARWPPGQRFPVIDLIRLVNAFAPSPLAAPPNFNLLIFDALLDASGIGGPWPTDSTSLPKAEETNLLLALRALANCFQIGPKNKVYGGGEWTQKVISTLANIPYQLTTRLHRVALSTLLFNLSCIPGHVPEAAKSAHYELIVKILQSGDTDSETIYRTLVALGNSIQASAGRDKNILGTVENLAKSFSEDRVQVLVKEIKSLLM